MLLEVAQEEGKHGNLRVDVGSCSDFSIASSQVQ